MIQLQNPVGQLYIVLSIRIYGMRNESLSWDETKSAKPHPSSIAIIVKTSGQYAVQPFAESIKVKIDMSWHLHKHNQMLPNRMTRKKSDGRRTEQPWLLWAS